MQIYGYTRVSTKEQHSDRQICALIKAGVLEKNIFTDKLSGKDFERPQYKKLLKRLKTGDTLIIKSIDRLGRNYKEVIEQWAIITKNICADIIVLDMPLLDTTQYRDLLGTFISDVVLQILSFVAQNERETLLSRQTEGIIEAKKRGVKFGRPSIKKSADFEAIKRDYRAGKFSSRTAANLLSVSQRTFLKWVKE
jgi:DNA invertase Pin-like site-specific DNA recombinase